MKENDNIKNLFKKLEGQFDIESPAMGHENRFFEKLKQQNTIAADSVPKETRNWKPFLAVAASIIFCFGLFTILQQQDSELKDLASISPELSQTQSFFTTVINQELAALEAQRSPETEAIIYDVERELKVLEADYETLKIDLVESGNDKRVIYAMITNFQNRIDLLQTVLEHIKDVKNFKINQNENNTTL